MFCRTITGNIILMLIIFKWTLSVLWCSLSPDQRLSPAAEASGCSCHPGQGSTYSFKSHVSLPWLSSVHVFSVLYLPVWCCRLQEMLRRCVPSWWEMGLWMPWHQRTWTLCRLEPIFSFDSSTPRRTGQNWAMCVSWLIWMAFLKFNHFCLFYLHFWWSCSKVFPSFFLRCWIHLPYMVCMLRCIFSKSTLFL